MKPPITSVLGCCLLIGCALADGPPAGKSGPMPGDPAPEFALTGSDGKTYDLAQFAGERPVVIAWFPKAFTGG